MGDDKRRDGRARSFARALIPEAGVAGHVADVARGGFKIRAAGSVTGDFPLPCEVMIQFEEIGLDCFSVQATLKWRSEDGGSTLLGFELAPSPDESRAESYGRLLDAYDIS